MSTMLVRTLLLLGFISTFSKGVLGNYQYPKECPRVTPMPGFDISKYQEKWYDFYHTENVGFQCSLYDYNITDLADYGKILVVKSNTKNLDGSILNNQITVYRILQTLTETGPDTINGAEIISYAVLKTDYVTYAVEYACTAKAGVISEILWILSRKPGYTLPQADLNATLSANKIKAYPIDYTYSSCSGLTVP